MNFLAENLPQSTNNSLIKSAFYDVDVYNKKASWPHWAIVPGQTLKWGRLHRAHNFPRHPSASMGQSSGDSHSTSSTLQDQSLLLLAPGQPPISGPILSPDSVPKPGFGLTRTANCVPRSWGQTTTQLARGDPLCALPARESRPAGLSRAATDVDMAKKGNT